MFTKVNDETEVETSMIDFSSRYSKLRRYLLVNDSESEPFLIKADGAYGRGISDPAIGKQFVDSHHIASVTDMPSIKLKVAYTDVHGMLISGRTCGFINAYKIDFRSGKSIIINADDESIEGVKIAKIAKAFFAIHMKKGVDKYGFIVKH